MVVWSKVPAVSEPVVAEFEEGAVSVVTSYGRTWRKVQIAVSVITSYGRAWREVPEHEAWSVAQMLTLKHWKKRKWKKSITPSLCNIQVSEHSPQYLQCHRFTYSNMMLESNVRFTNSMEFTWFHAGMQLTCRYDSWLFHDLFIEYSKCKTWNV